jgi:hypothetical protein
MREMTRLAVGHVARRSVGAMAIAVVFGLALPSLAGYPLAGDDPACVVSTALGDQSTRGRITAMASTNQDGCTDTKTMVWAQFMGISGQCIVGEAWQTPCYNSSDGGGAGVSIGANAYGRWDTRSAHAYNQAGTQHQLDNRYITVDGGKTDEEECADSGGYWYNGGCQSISPEEQACIDAAGHWNGTTCDQEELSNDPESPIVIATGSSSYHFTSVQDGVRFDIDGDGAAEQVAWTRMNQEVAFLAIDLDGNGRISSGKELFGNHTIPGESNGFQALAKMALESNGGVARGSISSDDPLFDRLLLWTDRNHNGISEPSELRPAAEVLSDVGLGYQKCNRRDGHGNLFRFQGWVHYRTRPGRNRATTGEEDIARRRQVFDVFLVTHR